MFHFRPILYFSTLVCSLKSYNEAIFLFTGRLKVIPNFYSIFKSEYIFERHCKQMMDLIIREKLDFSSVSSFPSTQPSSSNQPSLSSPPTSTSSSSFSTSSSSSSSNSSCPLKLDDLRSFHFRLKISEEDFNQMCQILREVLLELDFGGECLKQIEERMGKVKEFVIKKSLYDEMGGNRGKFNIKRNKYIFLVEIHYKLNNMYIHFCIAFKKCSSLLINIWLLF